MNTLILLNLAILLLPRNRGTETVPSFHWPCIFCDPDMCLSEFKGCPCGFYVDDRNYCFKCKVCRNDSCYVIKNDHCEDGYVCHSDFPRSTVGWYSKAGRCISFEEAFSYEGNPILSSH